MINKIKSRFYDLPIIRKLFALLMIGSILPLTIISSYSYISSRSQLLNQAYHNMDQMNRQINSNINSQLEILLQASGLIYTNSTLKAYLTLEYQRDADFLDAYRYINDLFYGIMAANSSICSISAYITNETLPADGSFIQYLRDEKSTPEWIRNIKNSNENVLYSEIQQSKNGEWIFSLGRIMNFGNLNSPYGVLTISTAEDSLYSMIRQESEGRQIYILNENGNILSTRDKSLLSLRFEEVTGQKLPSAGCRVMDIAGEESLVVCNNMAQGWKTVSIVPLKALLHDARQAAARGLAVSLCCFILALILMLLISRYFDIRFQNLTGQIRRIEQGDFDSVITVRGNDEIDQLSRAINQMTAQLNLLINELYKKEIAQRDAELYALQSQINPHFLYNALSVISSLAIRKGDGEISGIINHLSAFYRTSLNKGKRYITIENELEITRHYIAIQHMRFRNQFLESYEIDEQLYPCRTLKLVLQPFIENAINHAICEKANPLHIIIRLYRIEEKIFFEVEDDGMGIPADKIEKLDSKEPEAGFGIYNVNERIRLAYGNSYGVSIESKSGEGTKVQICIPM